MLDQIKKFFGVQPSYAVEGEIARIGMRLDGHDISSLQLSLVGDKKVYLVGYDLPGGATYGYPVGLSQPGDQVRFLTTESGYVECTYFRNKALERELSLETVIPPDARLVFGSPLN